MYITSHFTECLGSRVPNYSLTPSYLHCHFCPFYPLWSHQNFLFHYQTQKVLWLVKQKLLMRETAVWLLHTDQKQSGMPLMSDLSVEFNMTCRINNNYYSRPRYLEPWLSWIPCYLQLKLVSLGLCWHLFTTRTSNLKLPLSTTIFGFGFGFGFPCCLRWQGTTAAISKFYIIIKLSENHFLSKLIFQLASPIMTFNQTFALLDKTKMAMIGEIIK